MMRARPVPALAAVAALLGAPLRVLAAHPGGVAPPSGIDPLILGGLVATVATAVVGVAMIVVGSRNRTANPGERAESLADDRALRAGAGTRRTRVHVSDDPIVAALGVPGADRRDPAPTAARRSPPDAG